jgi:GTP cyclohydrolase I
MKSNNVAQADVQAIMQDVQADTDTRRIPIQKVGIRGVSCPVRVEDGHGASQNTVASLNMFVSLAASQRGSHMSRFLELIACDGIDMTASSIRQLLHRMVEHLEAESGYIEARFPYFIAKSAPVSAAQSLLNYEVLLTGEIVQDSVEITLKVMVPVTSLCPCSKAISRYGAHSQRSLISVEVGTEGFLWIDELITLVEAEASCEIFSLLKRVDEQYITEKAYDNPKFVEDAVRDVARRLQEDPRVSSFSVECENFESIHNHSAYAYIEHDVNGAGLSDGNPADSCDA